MNIYKICFTPLRNLGNSRYIKVSKVHVHWALKDQKPLNFKELLQDIKLCFGVHFNFLDDCPLLILKSKKVYNHYNYYVKAMVIIMCF